MMTIPEIIEVLKAVEDGKLIQSRAADGSWGEGTRLTTSLAIYLINDCAELRVKPEPPKPREVWVVYDAYSRIEASFPSEDTAWSWMGLRVNPGLCVVHFIENMAATTE